VLSCLLLIEWKKTTILVSHNENVTGSGTFSTVKTAKKKSTGETFAVKVIDKKQLGEDGRSELLNEVRSYSCAPV
jgi:hypothetical protein